MAVESVDAGEAAESRYYLGINIGGTTCSLAIGDKGGRLLERVSWKTDTASGPTEMVDAIWDQLQAMRFGNPLRGAGVAIGGPLNTATGEILGPPNLPGWEQVPLKAMLEEALRMPVQVAHDAAACALAEARFGQFSGARSLVYLTCGTGFGAGLVVNGRMLEGVNGVHPEIGHWRLLEDGPEAFGRAGSAEAFCSGQGLSRIAAWKFSDRWPGPPPKPEVLTTLATEGDSDALAVVDFHAKMTGRVCAMIAELLCPEKILLGSLAHHMGELWTKPVIRHYKTEVLPRLGESVNVAPASLGGRLQDLSALVVAMED